jgi:hypothetical protein
VDHRRGVSRPLLIPRSAAPVARKPVDQPFHPGAFPLGRSIKAGLDALVLLARDQRPAAAPPQLPADRATALARVAAHPHGPEPWTPPAHPFDAPAFHELLKDGLFMALSGPQEHDEQLAPRSTRPWTFVLKPPRLRPSASCAGAPLCTRRVLMRAHDRASDKVLQPVQVSLLVSQLLQPLEDALPDAGFAPAVKAAGDRLVGPKTLRQVLPRRSGPQNPHEAAEHGSVVIVGPARLGFLRREQGPQLLPLRFG